MDRRANLLGALALALTDAQMREMQAGSGLGASAVAALVTLGEPPALSVAALAAILGLTHSATVRLADDLGRRGLVLRGRGADRRAVGLHLTPEGAALRQRLISARAGVLEDALAAVPAPDRAAFERAVTQMLEALTTGRAAADHLCRLCDETACGGAACPVERRAVALS
jgi:DNA-binding MarR family transcriptional regulator